MPFRSKAQMRKMALLESRGDVPRGTVTRWAKETKGEKKLPETVKQRTRRNRTER